MHILVVGAGVGGLGTAAALLQHGHDVDIVEVKPDFTVYGVGINQPANSLRALSSLGVLEQCLEAGFQFDRSVFYDAHGDVVVVVTSALGGGGVPANNALSRSDLHRALIGAVEGAGGKVTYGTTVEHLTDEDDHVHVALSDGRQDTYDLVLGFDGIRSPLRHTLFPDAAAPVYSGFGVWRLTLPRPADVLEMRVYQSLGVKVGFCPLSADTMYMFVVTPEPERMTVPPNEYGDYVRMRMAGFSALPGEVRDAISGPEGIIYSPISDVLLPLPWFRGRVGILGDAAHACAPHLTQGAGMALEDGVVLAEVLDEDGSLDDRLRRYEQRRFPRARFVQDVSRGILQAEMAIDASNYQASFAAARAHLPAQMRGVDEFLNAPA